MLPCDKAAKIELSSGTRQRGLSEPARLAELMFFPLKVDVPWSRLPVANWVMMGAITVGSLLGWMRPPVYDTLAGVTVIKTDAPEGIKDDALVAVDNLYAAVGAGRTFTATEQREFHPPLWKLPLLAISSVFVDGRRAKLDTPLVAGGTVYVLTSMSGG